MNKLSSQSCLSTTVDDNKCTYNYDTILLVLQDLVTKTKTSTERSTVNEDILNFTLDILSSVCLDLTSGHQHSKTLLMDVLANVYRLLRNACANCEKNQDIIRKYQGLAKIATSLSNIISSDGLSLEEVLPVLRCGVQSVLNLCVNYPHHELHHHLPLFKTLLQTYNDFVLHEYIMLTLHACTLTAEHRRLFLEHSESSGLLQCTLTHCTHLEAQGSLLLMEKLCLEPNLLPKLYPLLQKHERETLLLFIANQGNVHIDHALYVMDQLGEIVHDIPTDHTAVQYLVGAPLGAVLTVLNAKATSLRQYPQLIQHTIDLLKRIDSLGRQGDNVFTKRRDLQETSEGPGLRSLVLQLLGNLVYGCAPNQDLVRQLDGLSLILDHTTMDTSNPFLVQWALLAVRNLCEGNADNQQYIGSLRLQGLDHTAQQLSTMGLKAEVKDGQIVVTRDTATQ